VPALADAGNGHLLAGASGGLDGGDGARGGDASGGELEGVGLEADPEEFLLGGDLLGKGPVLDGGRAGGSVCRAACQAPP
jgi:hypothetical protein